MAAGQQSINDDWEDVDWEDIPSENTPTNTSVSIQQPIQQPIQQVEQPESMFSRGWKAISEPLTDLPSKFASSVADYIDAPSLERSPMMARIQGFGAGAIQGLGDIASSLTSPINLATTALTAGSGMAAKQGLSTIAKGLSIGSKIAAAPMVAHGGMQVLDPETSLTEKGFGLAEMAGGGAAMMHTPSIKSVGSGKTSEAAAKLPTTVNTAESAGLPVGTTVIIKADKATPAKVKLAREQGFEFDGLNDQGHFRFKKTSEPAVQQPILESEVGQQRPKLGPSMDVKQESALLEAANFPRTVMASMDMSAPLRQGLGLIHKKQFWTALPEMVKSWGSEEAFQAAQKAIAEKPLFKQRAGPQGKSIPSFADDAGLKLTDLNDITKREESIMSSWAEKVPGVRRSNRAYTAFLNKLRADTFEQMVGDMKVFGADAQANVPLARELADFINSATGRGSLGSLESSAKSLSTVLFSPRLMASRLGMMAKGGQALFSPEVYMMSQPSVRREYLKSLMAIAAVGNTFAQLGRFAGGTVEGDPASSDFGKLKIGNTRIDPYGGFQQYIVAAQRLMPHLDLSAMGMGEIGGKMKSSTTGREYDLGNPRFGQSDRSDVLLRFIRSKTNPIINFGWGLLAGGKEMSGKPMEMTNPNPFENAIAQRFLPMLSQDIYDLVNDESTPVPAKAMAAFLASFGMGSQTYGSGR